MAPLVLLNVMFTLPSLFMISSLVMLLYTWLTEPGIMMKRSGDGIEFVEQTSGRRMDLV